MPIDWEALGPDFSNKVNIIKEITSIVDNIEEEVEDA